ncbi:hypothetical protein BA065_00995 [Nanoarchaeota archaeon NZ13-N]|uniref:TATA-box-binding protein n=1 Tax=Candidatus Nanoclepta minutus TaxID=1940235 RepID=A0A397WPP5_9ARCH|nr:MAG: hypothetical protein BA065_00995 [Nanoarchaeota archaeon NZ13-N]RIB35527.1 MAG: hypothetical protein BXU00_00245 [Candidatus Nanoclepta minutus]
MATWEPSNVVIAADLKTRLPLDKIAIELENASYDPENFPGLIYRIETNEKKVTILMFNSGKLIITGIKSSKEAKKYIEELRKTLKDIGIDTSNDYTISIKNFVANGKFKYNNIDINNLLEDYVGKAEPYYGKMPGVSKKVIESLENVEYNPEQFPGAIIKYKKEDIEVTFLVFHTGSFVCTGAKNEEEAEKAITSFEEEVISKYAKK